MITFVSNSMRRWQPISKTLKIIYEYIFLHSCIYLIFSRHLSQCENHKMTNAFTKYLALLIIRVSFLLYFRLLLLVEMKNHSKCGSELNGAADGVGKVTQDSTSLVAICVSNYLKNPTWLNATTPAKWTTQGELPDRPTDDWNVTS